jgi:hypothetical protein
VVQNWLEKDYPMLQKQAKKEKALILGISVKSATCSG